MKVSEKLLKPVKEANYLNVENTDRYRPIIRLFFLYYEKLKYWLYQEEIYAELTEDPYFKGYTMEQCQQDLATLVSWGNLLTIQDTRKVTFTDTGRKKLEHISDAALIALREELLNVGKATYQEALLQVYVEDVKKECKQM